MNLITVNTEQFNQVASANITAPESVHTVIPTNGIMTEYGEAFRRYVVGTLPGKYHLLVNEKVCPAVMRKRCISDALKDKLKQELDRLTSLGVMTPVEEPTDWVSTVVMATKKNGDLRACIDPRERNGALKRERYQLPILEDVLPDLVNAKVFVHSISDWDTGLDRSSSTLTTLSTPFDRYRWIRLQFGLMLSSEYFSTSFTRLSKI